jgi:hypothetical protein
MSAFSLLIEPNGALFFNRIFEQKISGNSRRKGWGSVRRMRYQVKQHLLLLHQMKATGESLREICLWELETRFLDDAFGSYLAVIHRLDKKIGSRRISLFFYQVNQMKPYPPQKSTTDPVPTPKTSKTAP